MIFKDHVQWPSQSEADQKDYAQLEKELEEKIGKRWPVTIKWHPSRISKVKDDDPNNPLGYRLEHPPLYPVTLSWPAKGMGKDERKHTWTYCENYIPHDTNKQLNQYLPTTKELTGNDTFTKDDKEFLMWLFLAEPNLEGGKGATGSKNFIMFDLPHIDKQKADEFDRISSEVSLIISHPQYGKPIDELRTMLTSYFVPGVDKMADYEVRAELKRKATEGSTQAQQLESMQLFLSRDQNSDGTKVRFLCQKGIEAGLIKYISPRMVWVDMEGRILCKVQSEKISEKNQQLFEVMAARITPDQREVLQLLEEKFMVNKEEFQPEEEQVDDDEIVNDNETHEPDVEQLPKKKGNPNFGKKK